jgi:hypothetical protein
MTFTLQAALTKWFVESELYRMFHWLSVGGLEASEPRRRYPEVRLRNLEGWLRNEGRMAKARDTYARREDGRSVKIRWSCIRFGILWRCATR